MRIRLQSLLCLALAALPPATLCGQVPKSAVAKEGPGVLEGEVVSSKGAPVPGAEVLWQAADGEIPHVLHTDAQGRFQVDRLRAGFYDVRASASGSWSDWEHNVLVRPRSAASVKLMLKFKQATTLPVALKGVLRTWDGPVPGSAPDGSAVLAGNIWFTLQQTGHIARFNPQTRDWKLFKVPTPDSRPNGIAADALGNLWFTENQAGKIGRLDSRTGAMMEFTPPTAKDPDTPAIGPDGALWFTAPNSNVIGRLDLTSGQIREFGMPTQDAQPYGIISGDDGALWFCELKGKKLGRIDPLSGAVTEYMPADSQIEPRGLAAVAGTIYFTEFEGGRLGRLTLSNKQFEFWDSPSGRNSQPYAIAADSAGKIWYQESAPSVNKLVRFDPVAEAFTTYAMPGPASPIRNMARDAKGRLWLPLSAANEIAGIE